jgi:hypothetical protein
VRVPASPEAHSFGIAVNTIRRSLVRYRTLVLECGYYPGLADESEAALDVLVAEIQRKDELIVGLCSVIDSLCEKGGWAKIDWSPLSEEELAALRRYDSGDALAAARGPEEQA